MSGLFMKFRSVKFYVFGIFTIVVSSWLAQTVQANSSSNVSISNNGDGSSNNVIINNDVNTNVDTQNSPSTNTHISIENNGQVKEYNSDKTGDVTIKSNDGNSTVYVNNTDSASSVNTEDNNSTNINNSVPQVSQDVLKKIDDHKTKVEAQKQVLQQKTNEQKSALVQFMDSIKNFFKSLKLF